MISSDACFECELFAGVTDPVEGQGKISMHYRVNDPPEPLGVKAAAAAALGEMPNLAGCACVVLGVKFGVNAGDSTLSDFFGLQCTQLMLCWENWADSQIESAVSRYRAEVMVVAACACHALVDAIRVESAVLAPSWNFRHCGPFRQSTLFIGGRFSFRPELDEGYLLASPDMR